MKLREVIDECLKNINTWRERGAFRMNKGMAHREKSTITRQGPTQQKLL